LLRHLRVNVIVVWDGGSVHAGAAVTQLLAVQPRLHVERFPAYAPELNPDEWIWNHLKRRLANGDPDNIDELLEALTREARDLRGSATLLRSCIHASELSFRFSP